jgi:hypothetical protein
MLGIVPDRTELERVRTLCLALPEVTERLSHGSPTWFVRGKKTFVMYLDDHHGRRPARALVRRAGGDAGGARGGRAGPLLRAALRRAPRLGGRPPQPRARLERDRRGDREAYLQIAPKRLAEEAIRARG